MKEIPELYAVAKKITLDAGYLYTDPRTLETTQPRKNKMKKNSIPKEVLFEELHIEVYIKANMSAADRAKLRKALNTQSFKNALKTAVLIWGPVPPTSPQIRVEITR
jgi:hypothetical protein